MLTPSTPRELEALQALVDCNGCRQDAADQMCISLHTMKTHITQCLQKTDTHTLCALLLWAIKDARVSIHPGR